MIFVGQQYNCQVQTTGPTYNPAITQLATFFSQLRPVIHCGVLLTTTVWIFQNCFRWTACKWTLLSTQATRWSCLVMQHDNNNVKWQPADAQAPATNGTYTVKAGDSLGNRKQPRYVIDWLVELERFASNVNSQATFACQVTRHQQTTEWQQFICITNDNASNNNDYTNSGSVSTTNNTYPYGQCVVR